MLEEPDRNELLRLARATLEIYLTGGTTLQYRAEGQGLHAHAGAFVSLHHGEDLRGCIGQLIADQELFRIVQHCVISAATEDSRFSPVTHEELPDLNIEISVLTPLRLMEDIQEIEIGKVGIYVTRGSRRGLLLPQVATQYNWDRETFLSQTCRKAGLPLDAWKDSGTSIQLFEAQVFSE
jgi:AmmeMemoRadiSam system protein A